jgi:hypothetical protein
MDAVPAIPEKILGGNLLNGERFRGYTSLHRHCPCSHCTRDYYCYSRLIFIYLHIVFIHLSIRRNTCNHNNLSQPPLPGTRYRAQGVVTLGDWLITLLIAAIPIVGLIMLFVWGFGSNTNVNKANWAKAALIWVAVIVVLNLLVFLIIGVAFLTS